MDAIDKINNRRDTCNNMVPATARTRAYINHCYTVLIMDTGRRNYIFYISMNKTMDPSNSMCIINIPSTARLPATARRPMEMLKL
jgi:hypothetical protein